VSGTLSLEDRGDMDKVVIRTDFDDEETWEEVLAAMAEPWGGEFESTSYVVNDREWDGATSETVKRAVPADSDLWVVFLADSETMTSPEHTLLAVNLDDDGGDAEFRILPNEASGMGVSLGLGNMEYEEWAEVAAQNVDGVFRNF
jgi:hypothetical protein